MYRIVAKGFAATVVMGALIACPATAATWTIVPSQAAGSGSVLFGVDALSATSAWAVGGSGNGLVERWDGTRWAAVTSPDLLDHSNPNSWATLNAVDATSATTAFAVGGGNGVVAERFNGTNWTTTSVPSPGGDVLNDVKAFSPTDAWAVGRSTPTFNGLTLARHWQGSSWEKVDHAEPGDARQHAARGRGQLGEPTSGRSAGRATCPTATARSNRWCCTGTAAPGAASRARASEAHAVLEDVVALSPTDAWAVGYASGSGALALRWNGTSWTTAPAPALGSLDSVSALSASNLWASGSDSEGRLQFANWRGSKAGRSHQRRQPAGPGRRSSPAWPRIRTLHRVGRRLGVGRHQRHRQAARHADNERLSRTSAGGTRMGDV